MNALKPIHTHLFCSKGFVFLLLLLSLYSCRETENPYSLELPHHGFPYPDIPEDEKLTEKRVALGKKLFFDSILSIDTSIACASCHLPSRFFTDGKAVSEGVFNRSGKRNTPTLLNVTYHPYFFREGGNPALKSQLLGPLEEEHEMALGMPLAMKRLQEHPEYPALFEEAYERGPEPYTIARAIAAFERTLLSGYSRFDAFYYSGRSHALTEKEKEGWAIFSGSGNCLHCHNGVDFSDYSFQNIGLYEQYADLGRMRITIDSMDEGKIKVPSLRNVAETAPYMHDGSFKTLRDVIEHYNQGGKNHRAKHPLIQPQNWSETEKEALVAFLHSLTDTIVPSE